MKESDLNKKAMDYVSRTCPRCVIYKIADRFTSGIPDTVFNWNHTTSWLEFKLLDPNESIHDQLDKLQLVELVKLENTGCLAWVIAFRRANVKKLVPPMTVIYRPITLLHGQVPVAARWSEREQNPSISLEMRHANVLQSLRVFGVAQFDGFDYAAISALIHQTHEGY